MKNSNIIAKFVVSNRMYVEWTKYLLINCVWYFYIQGIRAFEEVTHF